MPTKLWGHLWKCKIILSGIFRALDLGIKYVFLYQKKPKIFSKNNIT